MTGVASACKNADRRSFAKRMSETAASICGLVEAAAHGAYIIGLSDVESHCGREALIDQARFAHAAQLMQDACISLAELANTSNSNNNHNHNQQQQLVHATTAQIAQASASLCTASQRAAVALGESSSTTVLAKRHLLHSAKRLANNTAELVKSVNAVASTLDHPASERFVCKYIYRKVWLIRPWSYNTKIGYKTTSFS